ncbi:MAG: hypothetical protein WCJ33_02100 [Pseudomonadota bacterium]
MFKKKPRNEDLEVFRDITDDVIESDFVPFACHWNENSIVTKNGEIIQIIKISAGASDALKPEDDSNLRSKIREAITKYVPSKEYAIWVHTIRRKKNLKTAGEYKRDFSGYLNNYWNDRNDLENGFTNEVYISIVKDGANASLKDFNVLIGGIIPSVSNRHFEKHIDDSIIALNKITKNILPILNENYSAKLLSVVKRDGEYYSEVGKFLDKLISLRDNEFPLQDVDLSKQLTDYDVTFGYSAMEVRMHSDGKRRFGAILSLREYRELDIETLDIVLQVNAEMVISQFFEFIPASEATKYYKKQQNIFKISRAKDLAEKTGLNDILASDKGRETDFGRHQLNIFILADSVKLLESSIANAVKALTKLGMTPVREDLAIEDCYWAQLPANFEFVSRLSPINTARIGGFANITNFPSGQLENNKWGNAVTTLKTASHNNYFFNFHLGDNGHTTIIGQPDSGKNVIVNFLLSEARKFNNRLFVFDYNRSSEIFVRALDGGYYNPYPYSGSKEYSKIKLNPFSLDDTIENRDFLSEWLESLINKPEIIDLHNICAKATAQIMSLPKEERSLEACIAFIQAESTEITEILNVWTQGRLKGIFVAEAESIDFAGNIYGFEMMDIIIHPETIVPVISYLIHRINLSLDDKPCIIVLHEAWKLLDNPYLSDKIYSWLDYLKSRNALAIFATENVDDILESSVTELLVDKTATQIYLPDGEAGDAYSELFKLSDNEIAYLQVMNTDDRHFMIKHGKETVISELNLKGMNKIIAVLDAKPEHIEVMENSIKKHGIIAANWMPSFLGMI